MRHSNWNSAAIQQGTKTKKRVGFESVRVLQNIWNDWLKQEGHLSDVDFVDPNKYYHPLFGLGDENSNIMVVGKSPALTVEQHSEESYERTSVSGSVKQDWPHSFEFYRQAWLGERIVDPKNKLVPVLRNLVKYIPEMHLEDLYFTNVYKDQVFNEKIEETTEGFDPKELNKQAKTVWRKYLPEEIEYVDPELIITFGKPATNEIYRVLDGQEKNPITGTISSIDNRKVLVFEHWDYYRYSGSNYKSKEVRDEAHRTKSAEAYLTDIVDI